MASLDSLNLRGTECSFLEVALADVRRYVHLENKKQVLVFPPFSARHRFLIHTLVQNFFDEFNTISIGSSFGRRTVVYHSSLTPMSHKIELEESNEILNENDTSLQRAYRTPSERKAQEKLFQSLIPKKKIDKSLRSTQRKRPDIPIYVPKALRGSAVSSSTVPNSCAANSSNSISPSKHLYSSIIQNMSSRKYDAKERIGSLSALNNQHNICIQSSLYSFKFIDLTSEMPVDNSDEYKTSFGEVSYQIPRLSSNLSDFVITNSPNASVTKEIIKIKSPILDPTFNNCDDISTASNLLQCMPDNDNSNSMSVNLPGLTGIEKQKLKHEIIAENIPESHETKNLNPEVVTNFGVTVNKNIKNISNNHQCEMHLGNSNVDHKTYEMKLKTEHFANCLQFPFDDNNDSFNSEPLSDVKEIWRNEELISQLSSSKLVNKSVEIIGNDEQEAPKKEKKKKVLDVDECNWEDLYDKEDDYIHPLLMKELVSSMGKVRVQHAKEDYRVHQTIEERSGDGECVIEVYGFSSDLKTIDLMNQFAGFRKNHFEIVWVDDTHALAVFESPNIADRALNTSFALVKTRPLKNAIKESKLKAETIAPLPVTRPKTCILMARRLVSSALGLKMNVSPDRINAERTLLANAKERKIRDAQQKHDIWNNES